MANRFKLGLAITGVVVVATLACGKDVAARYHRWRFDSEHEAWRNAPVTEVSPGLYGQDFTRTEAIRSRLDKLVRLQAVVRLDHDVRLAPYPIYAPPDFVSRLQSDTLPKHLYLELSGSPRTETQRLSVWCEPEELAKWQAYLGDGG
jgi:hypothetical protein